MVKAWRTAGGKILRRGNKVFASATPGECCCCPDVPCATYCSVCDCAPELWVMEIGSVSIGCAQCEIETLTLANVDDCEWVYDDPGVVTASVAYNFDDEVWEVSLSIFAPCENANDESGVCFTTLFWQVEDWNCCGNNVLLVSEGDLTTDCELPCTFPESITLGPVDCAPKCDFDCDEMPHEMTADFTLCGESGTRTLASFDAGCVETEITLYLCGTFSESTNSVTIEGETDFCCYGAGLFSFQIELAMWKGFVNYFDGSIYPLTEAAVGYYTLVIDDVDPLTVTLTFNVYAWAIFNGVSEADANEILDECGCGEDVGVLTVVYTEV